MKRWHTYIVVASKNKETFIPIDISFEDYEKTMGGYEADDSYKTYGEFFTKYYGWEDRLTYYYDYLRRQILKGDVLSIGSGRCTVELMVNFFSNRRFNLTCTDIKIPDCYKATQKLFPEVEFDRLNILDHSSLKEYDALLALSVTALFNKDALERFFINTNFSLKSEGNLIFDLNGVDNWRCNFYHENYLKWEAYLKAIYKTVITGKIYRVVKTHRGYRYTTEEIVKIATKFGFELVDQRDMAFSYDYKRSYFLRNLNWKGQPYIRMFNFKKRSEI